MEQWREEALPQGYFPPLIERLHAGDTAVQALYPESWPNTNYSELLTKKAAHFPLSHRQVLVKSLQRQYKGLNGAAVHENILALGAENTFTVCTGQQLHIFLGPLFVVYKALSVISECERLSAKFPQQRFVPVFWLASEDHDMAEINWVELFGKRIQWDTSYAGAAGRAGLEGLDKVCDALAALFERDPAASARLDLFRKAYTEHSNLSDATRYLMHSFFGEQGLVCLDADDAGLKSLFRSQMKADILDNSFETAIAAQSKAMKDLGLKTSINPRKTNFFYLENERRLRIDKDAAGYTTAGGEKRWTAESIAAEIENNPGNFSPNVAMRPLYQECVLPDLAYAGGPGEMNYWFQIAGIFEVAQLPRPAIIPRQAAVWLDAPAIALLEDLGFTPSEMWAEMGDLEKKLLQKMQSETGLEQPLREIENNLALVYERLYSYKNSHLKNIKHSGEELTKKLYSIEKELKDALLSTERGLSAKGRLKKLKEKYFLAGSAQERKTFFVENYLISGKLPEFTPSGAVKKIFSILARV